MPDIPQHELDDIAEEREKIFTPDWFKSLFAGRLAPGDTFWLGNYGVGLFVVPTIVMLALLLAMMAPASMGTVLGAVAGLFGVYRLAILRALVTASRATPGPKGWRITGIVVTLIEGLALLGFGASLVAG